jgi:osmotically-inducible protein OsmY
MISRRGCKNPYSTRESNTEADAVMADTHHILESVRKALASEPKLNLRNHPIAMNLDGETLTLEGETPSVAAKKLALEHAAALPGVTGIVDRLRVKPAQPMGDGEIRDLMRDALIQEPAFAEYVIQERVKNDVAPIRGAPGGARGSIEISIKDGVVTLNGAVKGLDEKRLAGVLAWWIPGTRDVVNGLVVEPEENDSFDMIAEAVRLALDKDPWIDASQIRVGVRGRTVTLGGLLPSDAQRDMAECDAWYVFGVDKVVNKIGVHR